MANTFRFVRHEPGQSWGIINRCRGSCLTNQNSFMKLKTYFKLFRHSGSAAMVRVSRTKLLYLKLKVNLNEHHIPIRETRTGAAKCFYFEEKLLTTLVSLLRCILQMYFKRYGKNKFIG